ncbi:helix-turn-helix transcriptional regulator [Neobacillus sp. MER 74]|uniref:helix-turn-helix domain-containing protein n=1 Tax=Neobacillus sp. MER 74 TaxID=2939566 RepID=UPI00203FC52F|nr:helix-turn-helix transcriptional regulator [Neobacillus sp. MER 74]MCM3118423.1 helix-turn-helix transcriptional regulator [Neobacillus sp. MER 74]
MGKKVVVKLHSLLSKMDISMRELSRRSGVRLAALIELANHQRQNINFKHIEQIAEALGIDDIREIVEITNIDE